MKMKILMLTPYLPYPPSSGGQIRSFNLIKNLSSQCQITLFSLVKSEEEKKHVEELKKYCQKIKIFFRSPKPWTLKNILKTGFSRFPFLVIRNLSTEEKKAIAEELNKEKYDLIHAETFYVMPHIPQTSTPIVLVDQTIEFQVYQHYVESLNGFFKKLIKPFLYLDVYKIKYWELYFWKKVNKVIAVSEADKKKMLSLIPDLSVEVVPNGAGEDLLLAWRGKIPSLEKPIIFFQANFDWMQNIEAAENLIEKVFPLIRKKIPQATCLIAGQNVASKIGKVEKPGIRILNLSSSDIEGVIKAYRSASVFLAPLQGPGGTRLKILGAMAVGVPVVTTTVGIEGIDARDQKEALIADSWEDMAQKTVEILSDKNLYSQLVKNARKLVEKKYSYRSISQDLIKIYQSVIDENR